MASRESSAELLRALLNRLLQSSASTHQQLLRVEVDAVLARLEARDRLVAWLQALPRVARSADVEVEPSDVREQLQAQLRELDRYVLVRTRHALEALERATVDGSPACSLANE